MGRTELSEKERNRRINIILEASKRVFLEKGYFKTTMSDIAAESGLSRRTIYLYFQNKDDLSYEIVLKAFSTLKDHILAVSETDKYGYDRLLDIKGAYIEYYHSRFSDLIFTMYFDFKINTQILEAKQIKECFHFIIQIIKIIEDCLIAGIKDGSIRDSIRDIRRFSITTINIIHATMQKLAIRADILKSISNYSSEELIEEMFDIFFHSIKA